MILLSVITPTFNSADTLQATLESVCELGDKLLHYGHQLELILVDGGSQDSTLSIANAYGGKINNFTFVANIHGGPYRAMNEGLKHAKGKYSFVLNSDDFIVKPKEYASFMVSAQSIDSAVLLSSIAYFRRPSLRVKHLWIIELVPSNRLMWKKKILSGMHYPHPGFIAKTVIYRSTMFDERYNLSADYKLMQSILLSLGNGENIFCSQTPYVAMAEGGLTTGLSAVLNGCRQLKEINRELGIKTFPLSRYLLKIYRRVVGFMNKL